MEFKIKLFADGADLAEIKELRKNPRVSGFTTNPTLLSKAGIKDYPKFAKLASEVAYPHPISFEVFSDELDEMFEQAKKINSWGSNIYVKIPVTNTKSESTGPVIEKLSQLGIPINITALMTPRQVDSVCSKLTYGAPSVISVFAGRIADSGLDPMPIMQEALSITSEVKGCELLWASPREILNLIQADSIGCQIITMTSDLWKKMDNIGKDLNEFSLATVKMFYQDALKSNLKI